MDQTSKKRQTSARLSSSGSLRKHSRCVSCKRCSLRSLFAEPREPMPWMRFPSLVVLLVLFMMINCLRVSLSVKKLKIINVEVGGDYLGFRKLPKHFSTSSHFVDDEVDTYNRRYWSNTCLIDSTAKSQPLILEQIQNILKTGTAVDMFKKTTKIDYNKSAHGIVVIPSMGIMIPINDGKLQVQHTTNLFDDIDIAHKFKDEALPLIFCGFASRAQHLISTLDSEERPLSTDRQKALLTAMEKLGAGVTETELLSAEYAGTPPARIYRSFVCPRPRTAKITPTLDSIERAAERTAEQIKFAVRQLRADEADYLRNIDRPIINSVDNALNIDCIKIIDGDCTTDTKESEEGGASAMQRSGVMMKAQTVHPVVLVLDNIRSANNVGSMFRTAETAGAAEVITCGITAHPPHPKLRKTAMQSIDVVPTRHFDDVLKAIESLKSEGYVIVAMETTSLSKEYTKVEYPKKVALVLGNEVTGVDTRIVQMADMVVEIPTYGVKNSLNVAAAAPIVLFELLRQWHFNG